MTTTPLPSHPLTGTLDEIVAAFAASPAIERPEHELQTTRILINTYGQQSVISVLHSDVGLTDAAWDGLVQQVGALWADLEITDVSGDEDASRAMRDALFARLGYPDDVRKAIEDASLDDARLTIIDILATFQHLDVAVMGWSAWGVSFVHF